MRKNLQLNFDWKFAPEYEKSHMKSDFDDSKFETIHIPHSNIELPYNYFDEAMYQFVSSYRKTFDLVEGMTGKRILLHFEGVSVYAKVYLNDVLIGEHKGAYTPFSFDVTEFVKEKGNVLSVMVDATERPEIPPFGNVVDYLVYGGIYREVWLEAVEEVYIKDVFVRTKNVNCKRKLLDIDVAFSESTSGKLHFELLHDGEVLATQDCDFKASVLNVKWPVDKVELWDIDNPNLYTVKVTLNNDQDEKAVRFGFREVKFTKNGFFLNGKKIKLRGLNRHQSYPYVGGAMPKSAQEDDAVILKKEVGCNIVRTAHYLNSNHFLNKCDEIGLLVFTEVPGWQFLGEGEWRDIMLQDTREMVLRDRNHPSVIIWGVRVNEGMDCDEFYSQTNAVAHELDDTRPTGGVRNFPQSSLLEDVYTMNDFTHSGGRAVLMPAAIVTKPSAPILITEHSGHMYPTKSFDKEGVRIEQALRHARILNKAYGSDRHSGAIGWCFADYNTHKDFGSGDRICYHGVLDMFRNPKLAASVYASQQDDKTVMEVSHSMDIGEHPGSVKGQIYIFTNCDYVKLYKNGVYTATAYPNTKEFPHLPHPPISADDFIGDVLVKEEGLNETASDLLKHALIAGSKDALGISVPDIARAGLGMVRGGVSPKRMYDIVMKYVGGWGDEQTSHRFEGYKNDLLVKTVVKTASNSTRLDVDCQNTMLVEDDTFDVSRVSIVMRDQNGNHLPFDNSVIQLQIEGSVEVIGPETFALVGGNRSFWVRTKGESGKGVVALKCESHPDVRIDFIVEKK